MSETTCSCGMDLSDDNHELVCMDVVKAADALAKAAKDCPHDPNCNFHLDDDSDSVLYDYQDCTCPTVRITGALAAYEKARGLDQPPSIDCRLLEADGCQQTNCGHKACNERRKAAGK